MHLGHARATDGTRLAYQLTGTGQPLMLLAGQSNNHTWWDRARPDFAGTIVTMDYRGTGASDKPDVPYSTRGFADDAIAMLDELGIGEVDLYGTSMGGRTAQWLAALYPERVRRLVLGCTSPGGKHAYERSNETRLALMGPDSQEVLADLMYTPAWRADNPGPYSTLGDPDMPPHAVRRHLVASNKHDAWDVLEKITAPTLILHGAADELNPAANATLLADRIPHSTVHMFPGARHAYFDECRPLASAVVNDFLA